MNSKIIPFVSSSVGGVLVLVAILIILSGLTGGTKYDIDCFESEYMVISKKMDSRGYYYTFLSSENETFQKVYSLGDLEESESYKLKICKKYLTKMIWIERKNPKFLETYISR